MIFDKYISLPVFLGALAIGLLFVYLSPPNQSIINVYPTPDNKDLFQYMDKADNCFVFKQTEVACPADKNQIKQIPFQN